MSVPPLRYVGIVIQSFAFFAAIATFLGRIYYLSYYETIGIPNSEVRLSVFEYAVISPNITLLGIAMSALTGIYLWRFWPLRLSTTWSKHRILVGIGLVAISFVTLLLSDEIVRQLPRNSGLLGLWVVVVVALVVGGMNLFISGIRLAAARTAYVRSAFPNTFVRLNINRWSVVITSLGIVITAVYFMTTIATTFGESDGRIALQTAPQASVGLRTINARDLVQEPAETCNGDTGGCQFRVILIGDRFAYLQPVNKEKTVEEQALYAVPIDDIEWMVYVVEDGHE